MGHFRRNGDVNLHPISAKEQAIVRKSGQVIYTGNSYVMATGEVTGSKHEITLPGSKQLIVREYEGKLYYEVLVAGELTHTHDHETTTIEPDFYVQVPEREVDHFANSVVRKVVD